MKPHYFAQATADVDDHLLMMVIQQGYVPTTCLLGGMTAWAEVNAGRDPCTGCACNRENCHGRPEGKP
jgi:hypothetical protein